MQTDRTTKALLFFIAVGLWANVLKGAFTPVPSHAQINTQGLSQPVRIVAVDTVVPVNVTRTPLEVKMVPVQPSAATPGR